MHDFRSCFCFILLVFPPTAFAVSPNQVFLLTNENVPQSRTIAEHYCKKRGVPQANIIALDLPAGETISREDFNDKLRDPLRAALKQKKDEVKVLVSIYGVPLRAGADAPSDEEKHKLTALKTEKARLKADQELLKKEIDRLEALLKNAPTNELKKELEKQKQKQKAAQGKVRALQQQQRWLSHAEAVACVDSELMLLWWDDYELRLWQPNLLNFRVPEKIRKSRPPVIMVSRLDGPTPEIAKRLVDDATEVEKKGLEGKVYVDARGISWNKKKDSGFGYGGYDESLREMAALLKDKAKLPVVLDNKSPLFRPQSCPQAALYCGWYSLAKYVGCCQFVKGAVAYHIASAEARSLRDAKAKYWCPNLLKASVCATIGPVAEPYTIGFPKPAEFFGFLVTGEYTLVECYSKTLLLNSWMTVLVGDPLYNPYARTPKLRPEDIEASPKGSPFLFKSS